MGYQDKSAIVIDSIGRFGSIYFQSYLTWSLLDCSQGQYKSTLVCPVCGKVSVTFDPFMYLSLPLQPATTRTMTVMVFSSDGSGLPTPYTVSIPKHSRCKDLIQALSNACSLKHEEKLSLAEIRNHLIHRFLEDPLISLSSIKDEDRLAAYRLPKSVKNPIFLQLIHRREELESSNARSAMIWKPYGTPLVASISRDDVITRGDIHSIVYTMLSPMLKCEILQPSHIPETHMMSDEQSSRTSGSNEVHSDPSVFESAVKDQDNSEMAAASKLPLQLVDENNACIDLSTGEEKAIKLPSSSAAASILVFIDWSSKVLEKYDTQCIENLPEVFKYGPAAKKARTEPLSLYTCLEAFLREEPLVPEDMWYCPQCKERRQASKKLDLWRLPEVLVIHLKRFSYSRSMKHKLETYVNFPIHDFDLTKYVAHQNGSQCQLYDLYAVSNHYGGMGSGHYTAHIKSVDPDYNLIVASKISMTAIAPTVNVRRSLLLDENRWYNFDDTHISPINEEDVRSAAAYVLFYRRVKSSDVSLSYGAQSLADHGNIICRSDKGYFQWIAKIEDRYAVVGIHFLEHSPKTCFWPIYGQQRCLLMVKFVVGIRSNVHFPKAPSALPTLSEAEPRPSFHGGASASALAPFFPPDLLMASPTSILSFFSFFFLFSQCFVGPVLAAGSNRGSRQEEEFSEELLLRPLPDRKVLAHFHFETTSPSSSSYGPHHRIFPKAIYQLVHKFRVQEMELSFTQGRWNYERWGGFDPMPSKYAKPPGVELWAAFDVPLDQVDSTWKNLTHALSGLFCASINFLESSTAYSAPQWAFYSHSGSLRYGALPREAVCTENLTPWLKLLPCRDKAGLAAIMDRPSIYRGYYHSQRLRLISTEFSQEEVVGAGIELEQTLTVVLRPSAQRTVTAYSSDRSLQPSWSLGTLFGRKVTGHCVLAKSSNIFLELDRGLVTELEKLGMENGVFVGSPIFELLATPDKKIREVKNFRGQGSCFIYGFTVENYSNKKPLDVGVTWKLPVSWSCLQAPFHASRFLMGSGNERGSIALSLIPQRFHEGLFDGETASPLLSGEDCAVQVIIFQVVPWYIKVYYHTLQIFIDGQPRTVSDVVKKIHVSPSEDKVSPGVMEMVLRIPCNMQSASLSIDFDKGFLHIDEYPPDANQGFDIPSAVISFPEFQSTKHFPDDSSKSPLLFKFQGKILVCSYTEVLLVPLTTPDFSMPYNVITFTCTVLALYFGSLLNVLRRRVGEEERFFQSKAAMRRGLIPQLLSKLLSKLNGKPQVPHQGSSQGSIFSPKLVFKVSLVAAVAEDALGSHSEKLAFAFGLVSTASPTVIRIVKNTKTRQLSTLRQKTTLHSQTLQEKTRYKRQTLMDSTSIFLPWQLVHKFRRDLDWGVKHFTWPHPKIAVVSNPSFHQATTAFLCAPPANQSRISHTHTHHPTSATLDELSSPGRTVFSSFTPARANARKNCIAIEPSWSRRCHPFAHINREQHGTYPVSSGKPSATALAFHIFAARMWNVVQFSSEPSLTASAFMRAILSGDRWIRQVVPSWGCLIS
ncbi:hypothetical protein ACLOJK_001726 [Asimina triloba]